MSVPEAATAPQDSKGASGRPVVNWFLARDEISRARERVARITPEQREYLRRAKVAFEVGDLVLSPGNAVRSGSTAPFAANLFRQSLYWTLLSQHPEHGRVTPEALWAAVGSAALAGVAADDSELAQIATAMRSTFIELSEASPEAQRRTTDLLRRCTSRLLANAQRALWQLEWSKLKRLLRLSLAALCVVVPLVVVIALLPGKPDLAKGKSWHTSSIGYECHPEKSECGGAVTNIFFHTRVEANPWFEYDFASPLAFSSLTIRNRGDFGPERAVPLIVEVSDDDKAFREIARRTEIFTVWRPSFPTQHARYLRLRVPRETCLHLEAVEVHP